MPFGKRRQNIFHNGIKHPNAKEVKVSIIFTRIGEIDTINEKFSCEATLFITWTENLSEKDEDFKREINNNNVNSKLFWDPQLYIDNAIGDVKEKDVKYRVGKFYDNLKQQEFIEVHMIKRIQGTFFEKLELYHFPFDVQDLSITLTSHRTLDEILLVQDYGIPPKMTKSASLDKHIWKLYDHVNIKMHIIKNDIPQSFDYSAEELETACSHPAITMQCRVSRKPGYFIINCLLPTLMITLCVFFTFMMDYSRYQYRFSLLFTTMLTSITFRWAIHGRVLPTISYMTFLDVYCVSSIMIVFSAMVWHAFYLLLYKKDRYFAERCDRLAMISFAVVVILIHVMQTIWFIIAFKKRLDLEKLDKKAALSYLKSRMGIARNSDKIDNQDFNTSTLVNNIKKISIQRNEQNHYFLSTLKNSDSQIINDNDQSHLKPNQERTVNLDLSIDTTKLSRNASDGSFNSMCKKIEESPNCNNTTITTANNNINNNKSLSSTLISKNSCNKTNNISYIEDSNSNPETSRKASASYYIDNQNGLGYQYIPLIHQSSRDS